MRLEQVEHEPVTLVELAAAACEEEHPGVVPVRAKPDVDPVVHVGFAVQLVPDLGALELAQRDEVRHGARVRPVVRALAIAADGMLMAQAPVRLSLGPFLRGHLRRPVTVLPPRHEERAQPASVELAEARVAAPEELGQPPQEVRRERFGVVEHGELGRHGGQRRSVALPQRSHHPSEGTANTVWTQGKRRRMLAVDCGLKTGGVMKQWTVRMRMVPVLVGIVAVVAAVSLQAASARTHKPVVVPPDAVLTWNTYTVNAVRASTPTKFQTDGMVYMSYAEAAVYDAVTKMMGRYQPYHDFAFTVVPGASVQAAVAAASQAILDHYMLDQATVDNEYNAYITSLGGLGAPGVADGVAVGQAAAADIISLRTGDGLNNTAVPSYGGNGPILPGQWQLQPNQKVQTPFVATMRPFLLESPAQFRAPPPPSLTSHLYARDLNETEAYGAINSTVRTPDQTAIAYFWVGFNVNQYNATFQNVIAQHTMDLVDAAHLLAMGNIVTTDAGIACYDSKFFYQFWRPITAIQNADKDNNPDTTADPTWQSLLPVPGHPEYPSHARLLHERLRRHDRGGAAHAASRRHHSGRAGRKQHAHHHPALQHRQRHRPAGRRRQGLARLPLPQLGPAGREARQPRRRLGARPQLQAGSSVAGRTPGGPRSPCGPPGPWPISWR